jgi:hypothetical protein
VGTEALIHAVLHLEQVLTTGMRWPGVGSDLWHFPKGCGGLPWICMGFPGTI